MEIYEYDDNAITADLSRRLEEKNASIKEMEFMTKKLLALNERAKEAESFKSKFLSLIKNEFNNPMTSLLNLANILTKQNTIEDGEKINKIVNMLNGELLRLDFQLKNIFAVTEIEEGQIESHFSNISFKNVFEDAANTIRYVILDKNLTVSILRNDIDEFVSDASKIYLILLNLLSNACEYSYNDSKIGASIEKKIEKDGEFITISVEDAGEGISVQYAAQIYNRFSKFDSGKTRSHSGLGLGLSVVRGLAESLDGEVSFQSMENNTIFSVKLPIANDKCDSNSPGAGEFIFSDFDSKSSGDLEL